MLYENINRQVNSKSVLSGRNLTTTCGFYSSDLPVIMPLALPGVKCILGNITVKSPHKAGLMHPW